MQDDLLDDDDEDRLILDRSPDETGSQDNDMDDLDSDDDMEGTMASDGERIIYPWMKKIHVAGVGKSTEWKKEISDAILQSFLSFLFRTSSSFSALFQFKSGLLFCFVRTKGRQKISISLELCLNMLFVFRQNFCWLISMFCKLHWSTIFPFWNVGNHCRFLCLPRM